MRTTPRPASARRTLTAPVVMTFLVVVAILAVTAVAASAATNAVGAVTTLAGTAGVTGHANGTGPAASFNVPKALAADGTGNVYVADTFNSVIRKIDPASVVTTLAGAPLQPGSVNDANPLNARFDYPRGIAIDGSGNLYVADTGNNVIRKITFGGGVTTLAGTPGVLGSADGTGAAAAFNFPSGIAVDGSGNVYVADTNNNTVRKINPGGGVTTLAGTAGVVGWSDATTSSASFNHPRGLAVDLGGNVFVADYTNNTIRRITPAGVVTTVAGTHGAHGLPYDGQGAAARFNEPSGVAVDPTGVLYVADTYDFTVRRISPTGLVTTLAGTNGSSGATDTTGAAARFDAPMAVALDGLGSLYVADADDQALMPSNNTIRKIALVPGWTIYPTAGPNGTITASGPTAQATGGNLTFTFTPSAGYHVLSVTVDGTLVGAPSTYTFSNIQSDHTIAVTFGINLFTITPTAGPGGIISPSTPQVIPYGSDATFTVAADNGGAVSDIAVDGVSVGPAPFYKFVNVTANHSITASFTTATGMMPVFRFFNMVSGSHFYTADAVEKATVQANMSAIFHYDGIAYYVNTANPDNNTPLWRFYNMRTGAHFYTIDPAEKANLLTNMAAIYHFDGPAYNVCATNVPSSATVWRFFNFRNLTHFYTADPAEMNTVLTTLQSTYHLDGPAFYLAP
jgi:sugar lactone lactonase YvrE